MDLFSLELILPENLVFDTIIHTSADFGGFDDADILRTEVVNAIGTLNVCRLAKKIRAKHLVIISSVSACYTPADAYFNIYALSKRHGDELAQFYCDQMNVPLTILRPAQLYDAESKCKAHQGLFYSIIDKAQKGEDIVFFGGNDALRNYLFLDDFSEIVSRVIKNKITGVYACASPNSVRLSEIAETAYRVFNRSGNIRFLKDKPDIANLLEVPSNDLYQRIGFEPKTSLHAGIERIKNMREMS